jgi:hypothetical protein
MGLQKISQLFATSFLNDSALSNTLGDEFILCENGNIIFHWADFFETCDLVKAQLEIQPKLMEDFKHRESALKKLGLIPVWLKTENKVIETTMFDLYEKYILNQIQMQGGLDPFCPLEISFISASGPYKAMSIAECFNQTTYRDFVLVYLLQGKIPKRDYRIRLKSKILFEYGAHFGSAELVSLEQLTTNGMLLSLGADTYIKKLADSEDVRLLINTKMLSDVKGNSLQDLKGHLSQYTFNLLYSSLKTDSMSCKMVDFSAQSSFDFSRNKKVFLFVSYDKLAEKNPGPVNSIRSFVGLTKNLVKDHYQNQALKIKTA